ncbi:MAG: histidinol-phosphatase, partial [Chloroflexi bacterium]|nr:histidinol-phosphatase [Chloroflexota bacterium]
MTRPVTNREAARTIFSIASMLESQGGNARRVRAYRRAALGLLYLPDQPRDHATDGGELDLPWLGPRLRRKLGELVTTGRTRFHEELLAEMPESFRQLMQVPGIGPRTAQRLVQDGGVRGIRGLVRAARARRLRRLRGIGPRLEQK